MKRIPRKLKKKIRKVTYPHWKWLALPNLLWYYGWFIHPKENQKKINKILFE